MNTSYYKKSGSHKNAVSIAAKAPDWYTGRQYKKLAPKYWFFIKFKEDGDEIAYRKSFYAEVLDKLDAQEVFNELGPDAILLCWESSEKFCHRHIVAEWLKDKLGIEVKEIV